MENASGPYAVVTRLNIAAGPSAIWRSLMFFEQIEDHPPLLLRLFLPRPIRTQGSKSSVGDQALCLYEGGHLLKQVTTIEQGRLYAFSVVEQRLSLGRRINLAGGSYTLRELADGHTELAVTTNYWSRNRPRLLARPIETFMCHVFHRHLLGAIRRKTLAGVPIAVEQPG